MIKYDAVGRAYADSESIVNELYVTPDFDLSALMLTDATQYNNAVAEFSGKYRLSDKEILPLKQYEVYTDDVSEFHAACQSNWHMPDDYKQLDIAKWVLDQCKTDAELQRVGEELLLFVERNLLDLLRYLKYLVDLMRANNILWGVGRGSSVASYVLYLIGIHRINSMYYDLDIKEFLK